MKTDYKKLWKLLIDKEMSKSDLRRMTGMSTTSLAKLGRGETLSMEVLKRICQVLECNIGDVMDLLPDEHDELESIEKRKNHRREKGHAGI